MQQQNATPYNFNGFNMGMNQLNQMPFNQNFNQMINPNNCFQNNFQNSMISNNSMCNSTMSTINFSNNNFHNPKRQNGSNNSYKILSETDIVQGSNFLQTQVFPMNEMNRSKTTTQTLESYLSNLKISNKQKKNPSSGSVNSNFKNNSNNNLHLGGNKKRSSQNNHLRKEDDEDNLETYIENLDQDLPIFICSQKGSR
jgi:hypothetical protein